MPQENTLQYLERMRKYNPIQELRNATLSVPPVPTVDTPPQLGQAVPTVDDIFAGSPQASVPDITPSPVPSLMATQEAAAPGSGGILEQLFPQGRESLLRLGQAFAGAGNPYLQGQSGQYFQQELENLRKPAKLSAFNEKVQALVATGVPYNEAVKQVLESGGSTTNVSVGANNKAGYNSAIGTAEKGSENIGILRSTQTRLDDVRNQVTQFKEANPGAGSARVSQFVFDIFGVGDYAELNRSLNGAIEPILNARKGPQTDADADRAKALILSPTSTLDQILEGLDLMVNINESALDLSLLNEGYLNALISTSDQNSEAAKEYRSKISEFKNNPILDANGRELRKIGLSYDQISKFNKLSPEQKQVALERFRNDANAR